MKENVIPGPWPSVGRERQPARSLEVARIKREFEELGRRGDDVFRHLARKLEFYLTEVEKKGLKTGTIGWIIGADSDGTARHRRRFTWNGDPEALAKVQLCKTPAQWLRVLDRCAISLQRSPEEFLLEVFSGSRLRPTTTSAKFGKASWMLSFRDLLRRMEDQLHHLPDSNGLLDYISSAHLAFVEGELVETDDPILPGFQTEFPELPDSLDQLPFEPVCSRLVGGHIYFPGPLMPSEERDAWDRLFQTCGVDPSIEPGHFSLLMLVRTGICLVPESSSGPPRLALYKWPAVLLISTEMPGEFGADTKGFPIPIEGHPIAGEILRPTHPEFAPHLVERISYAPLGSAAFNATASEIFPDLELVGNNTMDSCWAPPPSDEGGDLEIASTSPRATVAGRIERNLLFADREGVPELRLDRLLEAQIQTMVNAVRDHRKRVEAIVGPARRELLASWSTSDKSDGGA